MQKWIEMVRVRSMQETLVAEMPSLEEHLAEISQRDGMIEAFLLKHALYDGDLAAVLVWDQTRTPGKTREGLLLAQRLQRMGTVDYAVWSLAPGTSIFQNGVKLDPDAVERGTGCAH